VEHVVLAADLLLDLHGSAELDGAVRLGGEGPRG
jgi:hypothetical protein